MQKTFLCIRKALNMSLHVEVEDGFVLLWERKYLVLKVGSMNIDIHQKLTDYSALEYISQASLFFLFIYFTPKQLFKPHICFAFLVCLRTVYKGEVCIHTIIPRNFFIECFGIRSFFHIDLSRSNQSGVPINLWYDTNKHASCWLFINLHNRCFLMKIPHCPPGPKASYTLRGDRKD